MRAYRNHWAFWAILCAPLTFNATAATLYVDANGTNATPPFTNWATAATNIQDAIDAASPGDTVLVSNGVYATGGRPVNGYVLTNRVAVDKPLTVKSVNGPAVTIIQGYQMVPGPTNGGSAVRCVYLTNNTALTGFTLRNGATRASQNLDVEETGGGVWCESGSAVVSNCVLILNSAGFRGGGAYAGTFYNCLLATNMAGQGGGALDATLNNCSLMGNVAPAYGGGAMYGWLTNCVLSGNRATVGGGGFNCFLTDCVISGNSAQAGGGGADEAMLNNCVLSNNAAYHGGGTCDNSYLYNCLLVGNTGVYGGGAYRGTFNNCTIVGNRAATSGGGAYEGDFNNCIVYYNDAPVFPNYYSGGFSAWNYCCTTPNPTGDPFPYEQDGNFTNAPLFVDTNGLTNLRLQSNSPCINSGRNGYVTSSSDLAGNARIIGDAVDLGAYEFQAPTSRLSYFWLRLYNLPTDGSVDYLDTDGDGTSNFEEWQAGTNPTNALSVFRIFSLAVNPWGIKVSWVSLPGRVYSLERATDLSANHTFQIINSNIYGTPCGEGTTYLDPVIGSPNSLFYRVSVQR